MGFRAPTNACLFLLPSGPAGRRSRPGDRSPLREPPVVQRKHPRWCLDRNQILQYGLGGVLPGSRDCWEFTDIGDRRLSFITLGSWMTLTALICEDLARQDPVSSIVRTVGPNLVVALLMDGPQLKGRWSSRYASVLAEDPGSSVLALTSLGMAARSGPCRPWHPGVASSPSGGTRYTARRSWSCWTDSGPHFVDFDDCRSGPAIQDLWLLLSGAREDMTRQLAAVVAGYEDFCELDPRELHLVEALRTLRLIHYAGWIARRWEDPAFPAAFPWFNTQRYWEDRVLELREQIALMQEPPLAV